MMHDRTTRRGRGTAAGFTLVEMVIVIGVIILLAALTLSVSVAVVEGSEVRQTENTIRLLTAALQEWEAQADRRVTYGIDDQPYDRDVYEIQQSDTTDPDQMLKDARLATWELFQIIGRPASVKQMLAQIDPESAGMEKHPTDPNIEYLAFYDAWGEPIVAVFPGRKWVYDPPWDDGGRYGEPNYDGTIRTPLEAARGVTANRQICFVSAGPDGSFGDLTELPDTDHFKQAQDNIYSYAPAETASQ